MPESIPFAVAKATMFLGAMLLIGAGVFSRWVVLEWSVNPRVAKRVGAGLLIGAAVLIASSLADVALTVYRALGALDWGNFSAYMTSTRHGSATLARIGLAVALVGLGLSAASKPSGQVGLSSTVPSNASALLDRAMHAAFAVALLVTFSLTSHSGAEGLVLPILGDLVHLAAMTAWVGSVVYLAWSSVVAVAPNATAFTGAAMLERVSAIGLGAVLAMTATGVYMSILRFYTPEAITGTTYGQAWLVKLGLIVVVLGLAGWNRFLLLPTLTRNWGGKTKPLETLGRVLKLESLVLVGVLAASGWLVTQAPPEPPATLNDDTPFQESTGNWTAEGTFRPASGGTKLEFGVTGADKQPLPPGFTPEVTLNILDHPMQPVRLQLQPLEGGRFEGSGGFWMGGRWEALIRLPDGTVRVRLRAR